MPHSLTHLLALFSLSINLAQPNERPRDCLVGKSAYVEGKICVPATQKALLLHMYIVVECHDLGHGHIARINYLALREAVNRRKLFTVSGTVTH